MATSRRRTRASVIEALFSEPHRFGFFAAVRLLDWAARRERRGGSAEVRRSVGEDADPRAEVVRIRTATHPAYPGNEITAATEGQNGAPPSLTITFLGFVGPSGVLPQHYSDIVIKALRDKSASLRDFLDLFLHRTASLFYRAWAKYRLPVAYERSIGERDADPVTGAVRGLIGIATPGLENRLAVPDAALLHYAGHFAHRPRSASALEALLSDFFARPVEVKQFQGGWLRLDPASQTRMPGAMVPLGQYNRLGVNSVCGDRVWDVQGNIRIHLGPLNLDEFRAFMPEGKEMRRLADLTRLYIGLDLDFDVQATVHKDSVPMLQLADAVGKEPRLGWNTWLLAGPSPVHRSDPVFRPGRL